MFVYLSLIRLLVQKSTLVDLRFAFILSCGNYTPDQKEGQVSAESSENTVGNCCVCSCIDARYAPFSEYHHARKVILFSLFLKTLSPFIFISYLNCVIVNTHVCPLIELFRFSLESLHRWNFLLPWSVPLFVGIHGTWYVVVLSFLYCDSCLYSYYRLRERRGGEEERRRKIENRLRYICGMIFVFVVVVVVFGDF